MALRATVHDENDLGHPCIFCSCAILPVLNCIEEWRLWHAGERGNTCLRAYAL